MLGEAGHRDISVTHRMCYDLSIFWDIGCVEVVTSIRLVLSLPHLYESRVSCFCKR